MKSARCPHCNQVYMPVPEATARRSGLQVVERYGREHMAEIGRKGGRPRRPRFSEMESAGRPHEGGVVDSSASPALARAGSNLNKTRP